MNQYDYGFKREDFGPSLITAGLSMLANNDGRMSVPQLIGQGGLDALEGHMARKKYEAAMARQQAEDERTQAQHDMQMKKGELEMAEAERLNALNARLASGDRSPEVMYGLYGKEMIAHELAVKRILAEISAKEASAKRERKQQIALWRKLGILPSEPPAPSQPSMKPAPSQPAVQPAPKSPTLTPPATPTVEQGGQNGTPGTAPVPSTVPAPTPAPPQVSPKVKLSPEQLAALALTGGKNGAAAAKILADTQKPGKVFYDQKNSMIVDENGNVTPVERPVNKKELNKLALRGAKYGIVKDDISRAKMLAEDYKIIPNTGFGSYLSFIRGTDAYDLNELVSSIRANIAFDQLQAIREASPTGGGLGNVTDKDMANLQAVLGSLETSQRKEQFLYNLNRLEEVYSDIAKKLGIAEEEPTKKPGSGKGERKDDYSSMSDEDLVALIENAE